jgi:hypothetical protein
MHSIGTPWSYILICPDAIPHGYADDPRRHAPTSVTCSEEDDMRIQSGQLVALGYGTYVRSDEVVAVEPITEGRGPGKRSLVWVRGVPEPLVASRSEGAIVDDLTTPVEEAARMTAQRTALRRLLGVLDAISPGVRRILSEETDTDIDELLAEGNRVLG